MRPIQKDLWIPFCDAAKRVGRAACGEKWSDEVLDNPEDPRHQVLRKDLYSVFSSCSVQAVFHDGIDTIRARPEHVRHPCFTLDIPNRRVFLGQMPGQQLTVELHAEELEQLLRRSRSFRSSASHHKGLEGECLRWLANETRRHNFPPEGRVK
jgi:hypothetical protein